MENLSDVLDLAEAVNLFQIPGTEEPMKRLLKKSRDYWEKLRDRPVTLRFSFLIKLLIRCPTLYTRPPGFEWVTDSLQEITQFRKMADQKLNSEFSNLERLAWRDYLKSTHLSLTDFIRAMESRFFPEDTRSRNVALIAEMEAAKQNNRSIDPSRIWRSIRKIDEIIFPRLWDILLKNGLDQKKLRFYCKQLEEKGEKFTQSLSRNPSDLRKLCLHLRKHLQEDKNLPEIYIQKMTDAINLFVRQLDSLSAKNQEV